MLKAVKIQNYQSHEKTIIRFVNGINVICGISQHGKTAILRAINWCLTNRPIGFRYHSLFANDEYTQVDLFTTDGVKATHYKTDKDDTYELTTDQGKNKWEHVNKEVPDQVTDALNLGAINIHNQFDSPLLITSSPTEIAKTINKVTGIEKADVWRAKLTTKINSLKKEKNIISGDIKEIKAQLKRYKNIHKIGILLGNAERYKKKIEANKKEFTYIKNCLEAFEAKLEVARKLKPLKALYDKMQAVWDSIIALGIERDMIGDYIQLYDKYIQTKTERQNLRGGYADSLRTSGFCPTCFSKINDETVERILEELK